MKPVKKNVSSGKDMALITCKMKKGKKSPEIISMNDAGKRILGLSPFISFPLSYKTLIEKASPDFPLSEVFSPENFQSLPALFELETEEKAFSVSIMSDHDSDHIFITVWETTSKKEPEQVHTEIDSSEYEFIAITTESGVLTEVITDRTGTDADRGNHAVGKSLQEVYEKVFSDPLMELLRTVKASRQPSSIFYHSPLPEDIRRFKISCSEYPRDGQTEYIFSVKDITTDANLSTELKDNVFQGCITHSRKNVILEVSHQIKAILNKSDEELIGQPITSILPSFTHTDNREVPLTTWEGKQMKLRCYTTDTYSADGDPCFITSLLDTEEIERSQRLLERKISFENILFDLTGSIFRSTEESLDDDIDEALELLGSFSGADRSYVFLYRGDDTMDNTHEWVADGITREKENLQQLPKDIFPTLVKDLEEGNNLYFKDVEKMDYRYTAEREILMAQSIRSVQFVPILTHDRTYGFMGFDAVRSNMEWSREESQLLRYFANNLAEVLARNDYTTELVDLKIKAETLAVERETSNKDLSIFFAKVSHEIRNSINSILGMTHMLLDTKLTDQQRRYSDVIRSSSTFLIDLVKDILDFSKVSNSEIEFRETTFSLKSIITYAVDAVKQNVERKGLSISYSFDHALPPLLLGDPVRIGQMINNLIGNAIKFTEKGSITVSVKCLESDDTVLPVEISVSDTGVGIAQENIDKLFTPFYSTGSSSARILHSSGLGLPIVKSLAESMKGSISVESSLGTGSSFTVTIPLKLAGATSESGTLDPSWEGARVVVIDSDEKIAELSSRLLTQLSFNTDVITQRSDLELFLNKVGGEGHPYALCFIDITMVDEKVLERLALCRSEGKHISHQIILTSVNASSLRNLDESYSLFNNRFTTPLEADKVIEQVNATGEQLQQDVKFNYNTFAVLAPLNVLIVEDIEINQEILAYMLDQVSVSYSVASSGFEAVNRVKKERFDVILLDIIMPGIDGYDTARIIRGIDEHVRIIAVTANATFEEREKCILAGMDEYLSKPIEKEELYGILLHMIPSDLESADVGNGPGGISIEGFNVHKGLSLLQYNTEMYLRLIRKFYESYRTYEKRFAQIEENPEERIRFTHSVKSIASSLGAENLATLSATLETIFRSETEYGREEAQKAFLSAFGDAIRAIENSPYIEKEKVKNEPAAIDSDDAADMLKKLLEACESGNTRRIRECLEDLGTCSFDGETEERLKEVSDHIHAYNFSEAETLLRDILSGYTQGEPDL